MADAVERFAGEARRFREWVLSGVSSGDAAAREALCLIARVYAAALELPAVAEDDLADVTAAERTSDQQSDSVYECLLARLPLRLYAEVFDPLPIPAEAPVLGDLADDVADILAEVDEGLRLFDSGRRANAVWVWIFGLRVHWGEHATSALRALHCYLAARDPVWPGSPLADTSVE